tara:strand:- start:85 stop:870 length:786 start_codon:yes stop_codon:yes gene_type:complete
MNKKILVIGESCTDRFVYGVSQDRKCPEAPAFILTPAEISENPGMARNTLANVEALGVECDIITNEQEIVKERFIDKSSNYLLLRVDRGENSIRRVALERIHEDKLRQYDAIIISDYNKGFLHEDDIEYICKSNHMTFIDTKKILGYFCEQARYININNLEYSKSQPFIDEKLFNEKLIVTMGEAGCKFRGIVYPVEEVEVIDRVGAGDTFIASLVVKYLATGGNDISESIKFANSCATDVVKRRGVVVPATTAEAERQLD